MTPIEASLPHPGDNRVFRTLSRWASRYAERNSFNAGLKSTPQLLIDTTQARQLATREKEFARHLPFSWTRFLAGAFSMLLILTEVFRSGLGSKNMNLTYPELQPDEVMSFGSSWNYSVVAITKREASDDDVSVSVWSYKFDSTSIVWRAFARHFAVQEFPKCIFYLSTCPSVNVSTMTAFKMINALVDAVAHVNSKQLAVELGPVTTAVRTESEYIDRLHQFLMPKLFVNIVWRTNQALYYSPELLAKIDSSAICFSENGGRIRSPWFCQDHWINFERSCNPKEIACKATGLIPAHIMKRLEDVRARFPNSRVDMTILESLEDVQVCRGGLSSLGFRRTDISTIIRARECADKNVVDTCETVYVDDYRYEVGLLTSDIAEWYRSVAMLRVIGQTYFWFRGIGLMLSCFFVFGSFGSAKTSLGKRIRLARRLFMKIPSQCVVYGSPFPVVCYVLAHLLDAPFAYNVLESRFFSQAGVVHIKLESFISYAVVQMRSVWVYTLLWQMGMLWSTSRWLMLRQHNSSGVLGVPEMLLSVFSSSTLLAQYRLTSIRSSKLLAVFPQPNNMAPAWLSIKYQYNFTRRGIGSTFLGGVFIDLKFLFCLVLIAAGVWIAQIIWLRWWSNTHDDAHQPLSKWAIPIVGPTPVPYSAGVLWSTMSLCVQWQTPFFTIREYQPPQPFVDTIVYKKILERKRRCTLIIPFIKTKRVAVDNLQWQAYKYKCVSPFPVAQTIVDPYRFIQHRMKCLHGRGDEVEANVAFMNAVLMSDPLVYLQTQLGRDQSTELGYYQSLLRPHQLVLLPISVVSEHNEFTSNLKLLRRVNASELSWSELVQCG